MTEEKPAIEGKSPSLIENIFDIVSIIVSCVVLVSILGTFIVKAVVVSGSSMQKTLHDGDRLILTNFVYEPKNGDIVVIPKTVGIIVPIIKRVIAIPGQTLEIDFAEERVYVDGNLVDEPYISSKLIKGTAKIPNKIPEGHVFVMGDNRSNSCDSRFLEVGLVRIDSLLGKAQLIIFPLDRFMSLS